MICKVDAKGYVVISQEIRESLGIKPGDHVAIEERAGHVEVRKVAAKTKRRGESETEKAAPAG